MTIKEEITTLIAPVGAGAEQSSHIYKDIGDSSSLTSLQKRSYSLVLKLVFIEYRYSFNFSPTSLSTNILL